MSENMMAQMTGFTVSPSRFFSFTTSSVSLPLGAEFTAYSPPDPTCHQEMKYVYSTVFKRNTGGLKRMYSIDYILVDCL
jgi:hypothetical protein